MGSSTGGTQALETLFSSFPAEIPPVIVAQHIPAHFSQALADRLNSLCPFTVKEARNAEVIEKNTVFIAPGGFQIKVEKIGLNRFIMINDDNPGNTYKPSVNYLFESVAEEDCNDVLSVILTGMGSDGAKGMLSLKNQGSITLAQNEESCIVFGMPRVSINLGAADHIISLE
ncbi:MAG: CheB methylesterase domain-containing protein [Bdellovibrionales bacterium]|nr:CheB methylesterase domain-containing protein [Bdellovibrionales bacterium]